MTTLHVFADDHQDRRVQRVVDALQAEGFSVPGEAPPDDRVTLACWTRETAALELAEDDERMLNAQTGRLVSILLEKTKLPTSLPDHAVIDLVGWRGSRRNAFFGDLVASLNAAKAKGPPPKHRGPVYRLAARLCGGMTFSAVAVFLVAFSLNMLGLQNNLCSMNFNQPDLSDFCGSYGLGNKPTAKERVAWETRDPNSCEALRNHIDRFGEQGALYGRADALLAAKRIVTEQEWVPDNQRSVFSTTISVDGLSDEVAAKDDALRRGRYGAEASCRAYAESDLFKYVSTKLEVESWDCFKTGSGHFCGFDGHRTCQLNRLSSSSHETCGEIN